MPNISQRNRPDWATRNADLPTSGSRYINTLLGSVCQQEARARWAMRNNSGATNAHSLAHYCVKNPPEIFRHFSNLFCLKGSNARVRAQLN